MRCSEPGRGVAVAIVAEQHIPPEPRAARFGILGVIRRGPVNVNVLCSNNSEFAMSTVVFAQISDCHLSRQSDAWLRGICVDESMRRIVQQAANRLQEIPDAEAKAILLTGDLSEDGSPESYWRLLDELRKTQQLFHWIPGNHDNVPSAEHALPHRKRILEYTHWVMVLLDSVLPKYDFGLLQKSEFELLRESAALASAKDKHLAVIVHHNPISVGSEWLDDNYRLFNGLEFREMIRGTNCRAVVFGHVHQEFRKPASAEPDRGIAYFGTPATSDQFTPSSKTHVRDDARPGFQILRFEQDGSVTAETVRC